MDIEKLIERIRAEIRGPGGLLEEAATALSTLQAENESLKEKLYDGDGVNLVDYWMQQAKIEENGHRNCQAENEKLWAELEQVKRERDAAIEDVLDAATTPCSYCKRNPINGGGCDMDNETHEMYSCWKWSGPEKGGVT